jgi:hypothetical protein
MGNTEKISALSYSFGQISIKIGAEGKIDRPDQLVDHMMTTAVAALGVETVLKGISESNQEGGDTQECKASVEIGEIKAYAEINFKSTRHISKRTLNTMLFGVVVPRIWETAALYFGDNQFQTTPPAPLTAQPHHRALDGLDATLGLQQDGRATSTSELREPVSAGYQQ